jgi:hypothetical protein
MDVPLSIQTERSHTEYRLANLKRSVGLILDKTSGISAMRVTIPIVLSTWSVIPLPRFFDSRRVSPLLNQSLVLIVTVSLSGK